MTTPYSYRRTYRGRIQAVMLDWAGTTMDFGCMAPAVVFRDVFERSGVPITMAEARAPMGAHKLVHIRKITQLASVRQRWIDTHGTAPVEADVQRMFEWFVPAQLACLSNYSALIDGALDAVADIRSRGAKVGSTTGYLPDMMEILRKDAADQGYEPDSTVCAGDVPKGRPYAFMCLQNAINLEASPVESCVKVDDTVPGIEEGLAAGMWSIGLAISGNEVGMQRADWDALDVEEQTRLRDGAYDRMHRAGAHYVIDTIADLPGVLDDIQTRMSRGERP